MSSTKNSADASGVWSPPDHGGSVRSSPIGRGQRPGDAGDSRSTAVRRSEYDSFADIYSIWTDTAASARANLAFYLDAYQAEEGPIVELGVGDGRIAVAAAARGRTVIGVDLSTVMLERCRQRAATAGVLDRVPLLHADFRTFALAEPAALISLPYHSIGHLVDRQDKRDAIRHIFSQLRPGGRFIFDDFFMTPELVRTMRQVQLRAAYQSVAGLDVLLWVTSLVDETSQSITVITWEDELHPDGVLDRRRYRRLSLSWLEPAQSRALLAEAGFAIEACFGDFDGSAFAEAAAHEQIWIARKPR
jgi:SAM-dependent methyltransferase